MKHSWNWTDFFRHGVQPAFVMESVTAESCRRLLNLPFIQGLEVIVTSVPAFAHNQWLTFQAELEAHSQRHSYAAQWLHIGQLIRESFEDVGQVMQYDVEQATLRLQHWLAQRDDYEQFALMACLHHYSQTSMQAGMMLTYLLQNGDTSLAPMQSVLAFYHGLTERQKAVATLAADGLTTQEIADALTIEPSVVAEHLTSIFGKFQDDTACCPNKHGTRYRLIHWLTRLFIEHPYLRLDRQG